MATNTVTNMILCFPCENYLQEKKIKGQLKSRAPLNKPGKNVLCEISKKLQQNTKKQAHLQSQESVRKKHTVKLAKLFSDKIKQNNTKKHKKYRKEIFRADFLVKFVSRRIRKKCN